MTVGNEEYKKVLKENERLKQTLINIAAPADNAKDHEGDPLSYYVAIAVKRRRLALEALANL